MSMWPIVKIGDILVERHETPSNDDLSLGHVRIVSKISFDTGKIELRSKTKTNTGMILARAGDLIISGIGAAKGAIALYNSESSDPIAATIHYSAYTPNPARADTKFLWWFFRSQYFRELLNQYLPGGIKTELKAKIFLPIPIPLPPLPEQRRIVARIEELAAQIQEARELRRKATEEAEVLPFRKLCTVFIHEKDRYGTTKLEELLLEACYGSSEKCSTERSEGDIPVLRIPNVASERINLTDLKYACLNERDNKKLLLSKGDVLVVRTNSLELVGRSAVVTELHESFAFASYIIRLRFDQTRIAPDYAQRMLQHLRLAGVLIDFARTTAGQYNVSLGRLRTAKFPVPPLPEQRRIVAELDGLANAS